jgi:hypothetical protein
LIAAPLDIANPVPSTAHPTKDQKTCTAFSVPWHFLPSKPEKVA